MRPATIHPQPWPRVLIPCLFLGLLALTAPGVPAADADGDGLTDEVEAALGSAPDAAEAFTTILERTPPATVTDRARAITAIAMANAGGNRLLWRIGFAADYPTAHSNLILYLDADANRATGRRDHGCEFMLTVTQGVAGVTAFNPDGSNAAAPAPRTAVAGSSVYLSYDVDLPQKDGQSVLRLMVLSETWDPHQGVDSVPYAVAKGPPASPRPKVRLDSDITESTGVLQTYGPRTIDPIVSAPDTLRLPVFACTLEGFRFQPSEYRADNVVRVGLPARIVAKTPAAGTFYPGFVIHDEPGREVLALYAGDQRLGVAVADWDDNDQHLFFTATPVTLAQGDIVAVRALSSEGPCRIEDLVLLPKPPAARAPVCEIRHLQATENRLTWITTWPTACTVRLSAGQSLAEQGRWNNHRLAIPDLQPGQSIRYQVTAIDRQGNPVASPWQDYTWTAPADTPTTAAGAIPLRVTPPAGVTLSEWPVTGGIPFPKGLLGSTAQLSLHDGAGQQLPLQTAVTARWPDGSLKWVLVDFRHSGPAATYDLRYAASVAASAAPPAAATPPPPDCGQLRLVDAAGTESRADLRALTAEET